jgi:hypothetical protein
MTPLEIGIALHYWVSPKPYKDGKNSWTELEAKIITKMHDRHLLEYQNGQLSGNTPAMRAFVEALEAVPWPSMKWVVEPCPVAPDLYREQVNALALECARASRPNELRR